ncbi:gephyrin-like molybdotransferase Glp [Acuticoccus sp. I52.16.1]|uniref:molybdopterin molybdotransferase MoeA n=1 Tax=Acuticoccus sp. I52.16.1 TaxID=2928472 RepID=UPI001FD30566|nr:gephyrin-like molybdotransferase Glp [Acuticoccus sp. I52.16.1]UOM37110.1 molybdopterin molybdotransferase MoeA [Acuticoccus sp. I52.16.1]
MLLDHTAGSVRAVRQPLLDVAAVSSFICAQVPRMGGREIVSLARARGRVAAADIAAPMALPLFDHAAVDGYGLGAASLSAVATPIPVDRPIRAGDPPGGPVLGCVRILTGAPVPPGMSAVVMQEHVERSGGAISLSQPVRPGANIRRVGEDLASGDVVVRAGQVLDVRHVALLAALGLDEVAVARRPSVAIVALGNEIIEPGRPRADNQIYDLNSSMAAAFFERHGCEVRTIARVPDDPGRIEKALAAVAGTTNLLITSGGMADGDEDHTRTALTTLGGTWRTLGIKMKPGKPAALGEVSGTTVLGLPGNPFAALVGLVVVGLPILEALDGRNPLPPMVPARSAFELDRLPGRAEFFPACRLTAASGLTMIDRLGKGGSARLSPLIEADALGYIETSTGDIRRGSRLGYVPFENLFH